MAAVPKLIVFDLDACLWLPEMFELEARPSSYDAALGGVRAGPDVVRLLPGAHKVLQLVLAQHERFCETRFAAASSTTDPAAAKRCLELLRVDATTTLDTLLSFREIYPGSKGRQHFPALKEQSGLSYDQMLFLDDCTFGDNCGDVARQCPGTVCVRTPQGLDEERFEAGLRAFASGDVGVV